jgi:hypothetical protein
MVPLPPWTPGFGAGGGTVAAKSITTLWNCPLSHRAPSH